MKRNNLQLHFASSFDSIKNVTNKHSEYNLCDLSLGINFTEKHIIKVSGSNKVEWVVSRVCDHASGTLEPCDNNQFAECPLHGWKLDLIKLEYTNVGVSKATLDFDVIDTTLVIKDYDAYLQLPNKLYAKQSDNKLNIRFISHACLSFSFGNTKLITDPWLIGPCFLNSWWHKPAPCADAIEELLSADLVYISHNHPDHMHEETLKFLFQHRPDIPIIIPNFKSKSTETPIKKVGFKNVYPLAFNQIFEINQDNAYVSILKSGDFRDDSGLYISYGHKQALITVDSSALNHYHLPKDIDFLATSFAGGASGHPWCFNLYSEQEKQKISSKRRLSVKQSVNQYVNICQPTSYMPYAGYFSEDAPRDIYIKNNNKKNSVEDIQRMLQENYPHVMFIDPTVTDEINIDKTVTANQSHVNRDQSIKLEEIQSYISKEDSPDNQHLCERLAEYFKHCNFKDELILYLIPCYSDFTHYNNGLTIDFSSSNTISIMPSNDICKYYESNQVSTRQLFIEVRATLIWEVINEYKSWEELSIGFHCRIHRKPDVYNSDFWYHFTNIYIK